MIQVECPTPEDIAAFIDRRVSEAERVPLVRHFADCEDCREIIAETVRFQTEELAQHRAKPWPMAWRALAIAASLVIGFGVLFALLRKDHSPTLANELIPRVLAKNAALSDEFFQDNSQLFSFSSALSFEQRSFRLGARVVDLEVASREDRRTLASKTLSELSALAGELPRQAEIEKAVVGGDTTSVDSWLRTCGQEWNQRFDPTYFRLGQWAEAGRLLTRTRQRSALENPRYAAVAEKLLASGLPDEYLPVIDRALELMRDGTVTEEELPRLERAFEQLLVRSW